MGLFKGCLKGCLWLVLAFLVILGVLVLCVFVAAFMGASPAWADGVGISAGSIEVDDPLTPGGSYRLPTITVLNPGETASRYQVGISQMFEGARRRPYAGWVLFDPTEFQLLPGGSQAVHVTLKIPMTAPSGSYFVLLQATTVSRGTGVKVGVAAATKLTFEVGEASWLTALSVRINGIVHSHSKAIWGLLAILLAVLALRFLARRFTIQRR